jgi:hypothetical protein
MATLIVMDHTGDSRHYFDADNSEALRKAEKAFNDLVGNGFTAAARSASGEARIVRKFDPTANETLFYPRLVGG